MHRERVTWRYSSHYSRQLKYNAGTGNCIRIFSMEDIMWQQVEVKIVGRFFSRFTATIWLEGKAIETLKSRSLPWLLYRVVTWAAEYRCQIKKVTVNNILVSLNAIKSAVRRYSLFSSYPTISIVLAPLTGGKP